MNIAFYGSSLLSSYWNGAATYYRGIIRALATRGHRITFYEPDAFGRQQVACRTCGVLFEVLFELGKPDFEGGTTGLPAGVQVVGERGRHCRGFADAESHEGVV